MFRNFVLLILFVAAMSFSVAAQIEPIDEFGLLPDEELATHVDELFVRLNERSGRGIITLSSPQQQPWRRNLMELRIRNAMRARKYDSSLISFKHVQRPGNTEFTQFWHVPEDSEPPVFKVVAEDLNVEPVTKRLFMISTCEKCDFPSSITDYRQDLELFRRILKANPWADSQIVIGTSSRKEFRRIAFIYDRVLRENNGIKRHRLRFFRKRNAWGDALYLVPRQRRGFAK